MNTKTLNLVVSILIAVATAAVAVQPELNLVPLPVEIEHKRGWFHFEPGQVAVRTGAQASEDDRFSLQLLYHEVREDLNIELLAGEAGQTVYLALPERDKDLYRICQNEQALPDESLGDEGYILVVQPKRIVVSANTSTGLFYGVQTLRQLIRGNASMSKISCLRIRDYPILRYRGQQDDLSRGSMRTKDYLKQEMRRFAELKLNMVTYYTEHIFKTESHPEFAPPGGSLTAQDIRELSDYASKYHITLVGNFQAFGHFHNILKYPNYKPLGETDWILSPAYEESYQLLADILGEMAPAYPSQFFNVNCDETWGLGQGASKAMVEEKGIAGVYAEHLNRLHDELKKYDKRMMMWGDVALLYPQIIPQIRHDTIMLSWGYAALDSFVTAIRPFREAGFDVMVCPGISCWSRIFPYITKARTNIYNYVRDGIAEGAIGMLNTAWFDDGESPFSCNWHGIAYGAEQAWNLGPKDDSTFSGRFAAAIYGDQTNGIGRAIEAFATIHNMSITDGLSNTMFWKTVVPEKGSKITVDVTGWDRVLQVAQQVSQALAEAKPMHYSRDLDYIRFAIDRVVLIPKMRKAVIHAAKEYHQACLLPLDSSKVGDHIRAASAEIGQILAQLYNLRQEYQRLWLAEKRMWWLENILAKYDAVLADLRQVEELLGRAIQDWEKGQPIPAPTDMRLDVEEIIGDYVTEWLACGSFPLTIRKPSETTGEQDLQRNLDLDHLQESGGEASIEPYPGLKIKRPDSSIVTWNVILSEDPGINLFGRFDNSEYVTAYAYCEIESPQEKDVQLLVGSDDGMKIFLNGKLVHNYFETRSLMLDQDTVNVRLSTGVNRILFKIDQYSGEWGYSLRFRGARLGKSDWRYRIIKFE